MNFQQTLADIIAKLDFLAQEVNAFRLDVKRLKENIDRVMVKLVTYNHNSKSDTTCLIS